MGLRTYISLGVASVATLSGAGAAQAAALQGRVGINPPTPTDGVATGIRFIGRGVTVGDITGDASDTRPLTDLDFVPPVGEGTGPVVELNANPLPSGENDFAAFLGETGTARDLTLEDGLNLGTDPIEEFIVLPGDFSVTLTSLEFPEYTFDGTGTTVSLGVTGDFINLSDGSGDVSSGTGTFSVDFAGLSIAQTQALFDGDGEVPTEFNPGTWSSNWVVTHDDEPNGVVPEASNLLGLLAVGLGGASVLARKKK